jgi:hypothetical protein
MGRTRKVAVILAVNIAGRGQLMVTDEECRIGGFRSLRRDQIDPTISIHLGLP